MRALEAIVTTNFIVPRLNVSGQTQPTDGEKAVFASETTLDIAANPKHKAADRPHLTMNDKVFAARYGVASIEPVPVVSVIEEEPEPEPESKTKMKS